jgi:hypothetical protein
MYGLGFYDWATIWTDFSYDGYFINIRHITNIDCSKSVREALVNLEVES